VWDKVNSAKPLWMRPPKEVTKDEYDEFYKTTFKAYDTPDAYTHFSLEGQALVVPVSIVIASRGGTSCLRGRSLLLTMDLRTRAY
tara:strand:- start:350 stop:604 length:255 start_codon:yes stop_codon:yes gene_type:complete